MSELRASLFFHKGPSFLGHCSTNSIFTRWHACKAQKTPYSFHNLRQAFIGWGGLFFLKHLRFGPEQCFTVLWLSGYFLFCNCSQIYLLLWFSFKLARGYLPYCLVRIERGKLNKHIVLGLFKGNTGLRFHCRLAKSIFRSLYYFSSLHCQYWWWSQW